MNTRYRKKPVVIEAFQLTMHNRWDAASWPTWALNAWQQDGGEGAMYPSPEHPHNPAHLSANELAIGTLEGVMIASIDDWIIRGVKGEIYACKPDIFAATYDEVDK